MPDSAVRPQLTSISSRINRTGASIVIEASEPAAYVATRPDPLTLFIDFRNVGAHGVVNRFARDAGSPIAAVAVEASELPNAPVSRVRITLAQAVAHRIRTDRNQVVVEVDRPLSDSAKATYVLPPASRGRPDAAAVSEAGATPTASPAATRPAAIAPSPSVPVSIGLSNPFDRQGALAAVVGSIGQARALPVPAAQVSAPSPESPASGQTLGAPPAPRQFNGSPVSLDFQGADLRAVLRTFAEVSGLNMVIDPTVQGTVDVALRDVPWDQALDIILRANKLGYLVDGTIVRIRL
jgi:type IV pilus assembly protein PilQ